MAGLARGRRACTCFAPRKSRSRAIGEPLGLPDLAAADERRSPLPDLTPHGAPQEADGLEWLLRLAVLWQQASAAPLRRTQQGGFFKRDLRTTAQRSAARRPAGRGAGSRCPTRVFCWPPSAEQHGLLDRGDGELRAGLLPGVWDEGLLADAGNLLGQPVALAALEPAGRLARPKPGPAIPFASAYLLTFLLLARLPDRRLDAPGRVAGLAAAAIIPTGPATTSGPPASSPGWRPSCSGVAYHLRLVQAPETLDGGWLVRLTPLGAGCCTLGEAPEPAPVYSADSAGAAEPRDHRLSPGFDAGADPAS